MEKPAESGAAPRRPFVVYRHGWNAANQSSRSCPHKMEVWTGEAENEEQAKMFAADDVTVYSGQHLSAAPLAEVVATANAVAATIEGFVAAHAGRTIRVGDYRPNGGVATWQYCEVEDLEIEAADWEQATIEDGRLLLFRHDGPVLVYRSFEMVKGR